ncbi:MAG: BMP family ABC transporter substrate-binding protein [Coriobacteriia bacterium]|nr:BMP family ABC transporter substrate-binding protein [Coriobacteriia bacterium]
MKKAIHVGLILILVFALVGCSSCSGKGLKIAIVSSPFGIEDNLINQDSYAGIQAFIKDNRGASVTPVLEQDTANAIQAVEKIVAKYDVIVAVGSQFAGIYNIAQQNPDKKFILVDFFPDDGENNEITAPNIYAMKFAEQESGFFAGVAAAIETKTGRVASIQGKPLPSDINYQYGFMSGVNYANRHLGTNTVVIELPSYAGTDITGKNIGGNYVGDYNNEAAALTLAKALLAQNVDIIFAAAGASSDGVFTAVKEHGNSSVIASDVDRYADGANGDKNIVLTSVLKAMASNVQKQLQAIQDDTFTGGNVTLDAKTDSTGYVSESGQHQLSEKTLNALADVYAKVKNGDIVPASKYNGYTPKSFPGL